MTKYRASVHYMGMETRSATSQVIRTLNLGEEVRILRGRHAGRIGIAVQVNTKIAFVRLDDRSLQFARADLLSLRVETGDRESDEDDRNAAAFRASCED